MPITIGELTSRVNMVERAAGGTSDAEFQELVRMVAQRLRENDHTSNDDGEIPERRSNTR